MKKLLTALFTLITVFSFAQGKYVGDGSLQPQGNFYITTLGTAQTGYWPMVRITQRDSIPSWQRTYGMEVYVKDTDSSYQLKSLTLDNSSWFAFKKGSVDLSAYVPTTRTINGYDLSANRTLNKTDIGLSNVPNLDFSNPANITQSSTYRFVSDAEKTTWNAKESSLTFSTGLTRSGNTITNTITQYTDALARGAQNTASTSVTGLLSSTDWNTFNNKQNALGFTPYNSTNPSGFISGITTAMVNALGSITNSTSGNAATATLASNSTLWNGITYSGPYFRLSAGTSDRVNGSIYSDNNKFLYYRNSTNSADIIAIGVDNNNEIRIAPSGTTTKIDGITNFAGVLYVGSGIADTRILSNISTPYAIGFTRSSGTNIYLGGSTDGNLILSNNGGTQIGSWTQNGDLTNRVTNISADGAGVVLQGYVDNNLRIAVRGSGYNNGIRGGLLAAAANFNDAVTIDAPSGSLGLIMSGRASDNYFTAQFLSNNKSTQYGFLQAFPANGGTVVIGAHDASKLFTINNTGFNFNGQINGIDATYTGDVSTRKFVANGISGDWTMRYVASSTTGGSYGLYGRGGTNSTDYNYYLTDQSGGTLLSGLKGNGDLFVLGSIASASIKTGSSANLIFGALQADSYGTGVKQTITFNIGGTNYYLDVFPTRFIN